MTHFVITHTVRTVVVRTLSPPPHNVDWLAFTNTFATVGLALLTAALAYYTWQLAAATRSPSIVATIEPNNWGLTHVDLHVENEGTASAYEIEIRFDPEIPISSYRNEIPLRRISVLKAGQKIKSSLCSYSDVEGKHFQVTISWRPRFSRRKTASYAINMNYLKGYGQLGTEPLIQIAREIKNIREDWMWLARGNESHRFNVNIFDREDRKEAQQELDKWFKETAQYLNVTDDPQDTEGPGD